MDPILKLFDQYMPNLTNSNYRWFQWLGNIQSIRAQAMYHKIVYQNGAT